MHGHGGLTVLPAGGGWPGVLLGWRDALNGTGGGHCASGKGA